MGLVALRGHTPAIMIHDRLVMRCGSLQSAQRPGCWVAGSRPVSGWRLGSSAGATKTKGRGKRGVRCLVGPDFRAEVRTEAERGGGPGGSDSTEPEPGSQRAAPLPLSLWTPEPWRAFLATVHHPWPEQEFAARVLAQAGRCPVRRTFPRPGQLCAPVSKPPTFREDARLSGRLCLDFSAAKAGKF